MDIKYYTENNNEKRICELYWQLDEAGMFELSIKDIAAKSGNTHYQINKIVKDGCSACSDETFCEDCGQPYIYGNRTDYLNHHEGQEWICPDCINQALNDENRIKRELRKRPLNTPYRIESTLV